MSTQRAPRSSAEWVTFGVASAILLALMGTIGWLGMQPHDSASITVTPTGESREAGGYRYLTADVTNEGSEAVEAVQIFAEAKIDGEPVDAEQGIDFLSGGETEQVVFVFDVAVPSDEVEMRIASYKLP